MPFHLHKALSTAQPVRTCRRTLGQEGEPGEASPARPSPRLQNRIAKPLYSAQWGRFPRETDRFAASRIARNTASALAPLTMAKATAKRRASVSTKHRAIGCISAIALGARTSALPDATSVLAPSEHPAGADKPSARAAISNDPARTNHRRSRPCRRLAGEEPPPPTAEAVAREP